MKKKCRNDQQHRYEEQKNMFIGFLIGTGMMIILLITKTYRQ